MLTGDGQVRRVSAADTSAPVESFGRMRIPRGFSARDSRARKDLAATLREVVADVPHEHRRRRSGVSEDERIAALRKEMRAHPCHGCADRETHARWAERYHRTERQAHDLTRRVEGRTSSIAKRFDRVCEVLTALGYLSSADDAATVTESGLLLMRLYTESDLLTAQSLLDGAWQELTAPELAAVCSAVVYESRGQDDDSAPALPTRAIRDSLRVLVSTWSDLHALESDHGLDVTRRPDPGLVDAVYRWATGGTLLQVLTHADITAGDFVRWTRQVIDVLGQLSTALAPEDPLRDTAREAIERVNRGVIAYSSSV